MYAKFTLMLHVTCASVSNRKSLEGVCVHVLYMYDFLLFICHYLFISLISQVVVKIASKYYEQLSTTGLIDLFESFKSFEGALWAWSLVVDYFCRIVLFLGIYC